MLYKTLLIASAALASASKIVYTFSDGADCEDAKLKAALMGATSQVPGAAGDFGTGWVWTTDGTTKTGSADSAKADEISTFWAGKEDTLKTVIVQVACTTITSVKVCTNTDGAACSGGGGGGGSDDPCFPATAYVTLADGTPKKIGQLKEGDAILAATLEGGLAVDTVSFLSLADSAAQAKAFISLTTDAKNRLNATIDHHVATGDKCCSQIKKVSEIRTGDTLWVKTPGSPLPVAQKVADAKFFAANGLFSPVLTNGGLPIVDNFVTAFDQESKVKSAAKWLPSLISLCKSTGTCGLAQKFFDFSERKHIA